MTPPCILVIDDERNFREFLGEALEQEGFAVELAATGKAGLSLARMREPDVVLLDQNLPDGSGLDLLAELRKLPSRPEIIVVTAFADYPEAVDAIKAGAYNYLSKPFEFSELLHLLRERARTAPAAGPDRDPSIGLLGESPEIVELRRQVRRVAASPVSTILLQGESGTGKELVAQGIHRLSARRERRLVAVNCAALTDTLLLSELFGHERGSFTGALRTRPGLFEAARGGTLFLDEVSEMDFAAQAALLRTLEERSVRRVGGTEEIPVDVRVIAASNRPLEERVAEGRFREDLFFRLDLVRLRTPPLRERGADILLLARRFAAEIAARYGESPRTITPAAAGLLQSYTWPGNVRELQNAIEQAYATASGSAIRPEDLPRVLSGRASLRPGPRLDLEELTEMPFREAKREAVKRLERSYVEKALRHTAGNVTRAAERAGMVRQAFQRLVARAGVEVDEFRP